MALPVLSNDKPMYEVVVPSTQEMFKFRPFLVKEQKSMLIAFESKVRDAYEAGQIKGPIHLAKNNEEQLIEIFQYILMLELT